MQEFLPVTRHPSLVTDSIVHHRSPVTTCSVRHTSRVSADCVPVCVPHCVWLDSQHGSLYVHRQTWRHAVFDRVASPAQLQRHREVERHRARLRHSSRAEAQAIRRREVECGATCNPIGKASDDGTRSSFEDATSDRSADEMAMACHRWQCDADFAPEWWIWVDDRRKTRR